MYRILPYTYAKAKVLGVEIKPSKRKNKKIDVYTPDGIVSIGDTRYKDYPTYKKFDGSKTADFRRRLYHLRHKGDEGIAGYYAKELLW
ncbi:MAG: hypothetical protein EBR82_27760 [Caulobacteraceae bacterium]|nr:hypothetical protein [Caulobacteraceae bacterium]